MDGIETGVVMFATNGQLWVSEEGDKEPRWVGKVTQCRSEPSGQLIQIVTIPDEEMT